MKSKFLIQKTWISAKQLGCQPFFWLISQDKLDFIQKLGFQPKKLGRENWPEKIGYQPTLCFESAIFFG
jgi:hypothetical protein